MKEKIVSIIILFLIFGFALFIRIFFSYDKVFSEPIKYAADDAIYHMRLVENELLGNHFPRRIYFDPYTYFPYGAYIPVAPLYDGLLSGIIWLTSLGKPTNEIINLISPFFPAVLGSLAVFLVYFIGKAIWDKRVGLFSAFLIAISSPFLYTSLLGSNDHHVAEVLFSTLAMMFLFFVVKEIKKEKSSNKKFWIYTFLTGFSLGLYFLTWIGAVLFLFIIFIFLILYYLIEYLSGKSVDNILIGGIFIFLIVLIMISPFLGHPDIFRSPMYNIQHLEALICGIIGFLAILVFGKLVKKKNLNRWHLLLFTALSVALFLIILKLAFPYFFEKIIETFKAVNTGIIPHELAQQLVVEATPLNFQGAVNFFSALFFFFLVALFLIIYKFIKKRKPEYLLIFIWATVIFLITGIIPFWGQNRFVVYLSVDISLLAGFLIVRGFEFGWRGLKIDKTLCLHHTVRPYFLAGSLLIIFNVIFFLLFPFPFNAADPFPQNLPAIFRLALENAKLGLFTRENDWYDAMRWLRENTPDPGVNYYALYQEPGVERETGRINPYPYPKDAYGVLARWDVGHMITYYARRVPNANPFQQGVGKKEGEKVTEPGAFVFFLETEEEKATEYLDALKTRYVITDSSLANPESYFKSMVKWLQGDFKGYLVAKASKEEKSRFDNSMIARLHILDGTETTTERKVNDKTIKFYIKPLDHFRLVYESPKTIVSSSKDWGEIKVVKVFEYVKGAKISGKTEPENKITISTEVETNQQRKFIYEKSVEAKDGYFEFIVPYSTFGEKGRLAGETQFGVFANPYKLKIGSKVIEINVSEKDILEGKTIEVLLFF